MIPAARRAILKLIEDGILSKHPKSYRLSEECRKLIEELARVLGISQTAVVEFAVRKLAKVELGAKVAATPKPNGRRKGKA
jgi:hypothetical protein